jgi:hypothetical protein
MIRGPRPFDGYSRVNEISGDKEFSFVVMTGLEARKACKCLFYVRSHRVEKLYAEQITP